MKPINKELAKDSFIVLILIIGIIGLMLLNPLAPPDVPPSKYQMPDVEGGPYWTIYIDNLSTTDDEMFIIWEGYEGDFMDAEHFIPAVNHTYRFTYVGSNGTYLINISANEAYNGT